MDGYRNTALEKGVFTLPQQAQVACLYQFWGILNEPWAKRVQPENVADLTDRFLTHYKGSFERQVPRGRERPSTYTHTRKHVRAERSPECTTYTPPKRCNADTCVMPTFITANLRGRVRGLFVPFNLANLQQFVRTTLQTAVQRCNSTR
eukprot:249194-Prorocentrum_minimum.AAC.1